MMRSIDICVTSHAELDVQAGSHAIYTQTKYEISYIITINQGTKPKVMKLL